MRTTYRITATLIALFFSLSCYLPAQPAPSVGSPGAKPETKAGQTSSSPDIARYTIIGFQDKNVGEGISRKYEVQLEGLSQDASRGYLGSLFGQFLGATKSLVSTNVTGLVTSGIGMISELVRSKKDDWRKVVAAENRFTKTLTMLENVEDFYADISLTGALDPSSIAFNGIGCLQTRGRDTVLYISCRLDTTEQGVARILRHSKFQLVLDTLIFNPSLCDLPNDSTRPFSQRQRFSFANRSRVSLGIKMDITSSWINQAIQVYNDHPLGSFSISVPIDSASLDADSVFRFRRGGNNRLQGCSVSGECFIVPRSYIGVRDGNGVFHDAWGTGQYKVRMTLTEACGTTPSFERNWKADWKRRKRSKRESTNFGRVMKQTWNANGSKWVATLIEAPATMLTNDFLDLAGMSQPAAAQAKAGMPGAAAGKAQQGKPAQQGGMPAGQGGASAGKPNK